MQAVQCWLWEGEAAGRSSWGGAQPSPSHHGALPCPGCSISRAHAGAAAGHHLLTPAPPYPPSLLRGFCLIPYAPFLFFFLTEEAGSCI